MPSTPTVTDPTVTRRESARRGRYAAQRTVWRESRLDRLKACGKRVSDRAGGVAVKVTGTGADARAGFGGLQTCGSVWSCPVCSEKINAERQHELEAGIRGWMGAGGAVLMGTLTVRHHRGQRLARLLDAIGPAWNRTTSGAGVAWNGGKREMGDKARFGIAGYTRVVETKHGENGWHPHIHFLLFLEEPLSVVQVKDLEARMFGRWESALARRGLSVLREVGIDLRQVEDDESGAVLADYFTKNTYSAPTPGRAAYEVTGSQSKVLGKGGRTPFQILADLVRDGDADDLDLWHEWEKASHGRRQLTWSRGLRARLALGVERSDQEVAEDEAGGEVVFVFRREEWVEGRWFDRKIELLEAAEAGTIAQLLWPLLLARRE